MSLHTLFVVNGLAQTTPTGQLEELALGGSLLVFLLVFTVVSYLANAVLTLVIGASLVAVAAEWLRAIERRVAEKPIRSGAVGFGAIVGGIVAYVVFVSVVLFVIDAAGLPESAESVVLLTGLAIALGFFVMTTVGELIAGSALLKHFGSDDDPSLWVALGVAALVVNAAYLVPLAGSLVALVLLSVATGAVVDRWWQSRGDDAPPANPTVESADD